VIFTIGLRELKSLFLSPLAWSILAVVQLILAYLFLGRIEIIQLYQAQLMAMDGAPGVTEIILPDLLGNAAIILLLVVPLLTMRLVAEERRNRTLSLLFSSPLSMTEIVLGNTSHPPVPARAAGADRAHAAVPARRGPAGFRPAGGKLFGVGAAARGLRRRRLFMSTLTQYTTVAAISTFGALLLFWILDWSGQGFAGGNWLAYLSLFNHYKPFLDGIFDSADAVYHVLLITTFLVLSIHRLDADRLGGN